MTTYQTYYYFQRRKGYGTEVVSRNTIVEAVNESEAYRLTLIKAMCENEHLINFHVWKTEPVNTHPVS